MKLQTKSIDNSNFEIKGTLNKECQHIQFFTKNKIIKLLEDNNFEIERFENSIFLYGPISKYAFSNFRFLKKINDWCRDKVSHSLASDWLIISKPK